jgi:hypothetical protein
MNSRRLIMAPKALGIVAAKTNDLEGDQMSALWSKADISRRNRHVGFTPESGHVRCKNGCPLWAKSGHLGVKYVTHPLTTSG